MKNDPAGKVYADSLFEVCIEKGSVEEVGEDLKSLAALLSELSDFNVFLSSPSIAPEAKLKVIEKVFKKKTHQITLNFLLSLIRRGRFLLFNSIVFRFTTLMDQHLGKIRVTCSTAVPLTDKTAKEVNKVLKKKFPQKEIILTTQVEPELMGGFLLETEGQIIDASLQKKLSNFRKNLVAKTNVVLNG